MKTYLVPAPESNTNSENKTMAHIADNLVGDWVWITAKVDPAVKPERDGSFFYDLRLWTMHQGAMLQALTLVEPKPGDHIVFADAWFPGLSLVRLLYPECYLVGFVHGTAFMPGDLMARFDWAVALQTAWFKILDGLLVQTKYTEEWIPGGDRNKSVVIGSPFDPAPFKRGADPKQEFDVIWPHRPSEDKGFSQFLEVAEILTAGDYSVVVSTPDKELDSKIEERILEAGAEIRYRCVGERYLEILHSSQVVLSTAKQETWGYAVMEAVAAGCIPVLPDQACYPYLYDADFLYDPEMSSVTIACRCKRMMRDNWMPPSMPTINIKGKFVGGSFTTIT